MQYRGAIFGRTRNRCTKRIRQTAPRQPFEFSVWLVDKKLRLGYWPRVGYYPISVTYGTEPHAPVKMISGPDLRTMKRKQAGVAAKESQFKHLAAIESTLFQPLTNLVAHCCITKYDDGEVRKPGWFTVKTQGSSWVVQCKDPDSGMSLQAIGQSLDDALVLADALLGAEEAPWEPDPWLKRTNSKKAA